VGTVKSIGSPNIRAASSGDGVPTFWVSGMVGFDFKGLDLAAAISSLGEVRLLLDTVGGDAADAFAFYDAVRVKGLKVHVEGYGRVASAGTVIMAAAGRSRSALAPNAEYLIHEASGGDEVVVERYNERMARLYSELSGMTEKEVRKIMKEDRFMSATEAKKLKLVGMVLQHEAIAAQYKTMEDNTIETPEVETPEVVVETTEAEVDTTEVEVPVTVQEAVTAAWNGAIKVKVAVAKDMRDALATALSEAKDTKASLDEVTSEVEALKEKLTASEDARTKAEAKVAEIEPKLAEITAQVETLKATPVEGVKASAEPKDVQIPGGGPAGVVATPQGKREARKQAVAEAMEKTLSKHKLR